MTRPPVSGSMAGHCRNEIWLAANGHSKAIPDIDTQITFDMGHLMEQATFGGFPNMPPWWDRLEKLVDPISGFELDPSDYFVSHRQLEVEFEGFSGHIDVLLTHRQTGELILPDMKTAGRYSFEKNMRENLTENVFTREYVCQLHDYLCGVRLLMDKNAKMVLLFFNKDAKRGEPRFGIRLVEYSPAIVSEIKERLAWARSHAMPEPEYVWTPDKPLPLRCQYCDLVTACAESRGAKLYDGKKGLEAAFVSN